MKYQLRPYQQAASDAAIQFFQDTDPRNGLIVASTGSGKSLLVADIAYRLNSNVLVFCPSREITLQNYSKMCSYGVECSMYSASVKQKVISPITFATIGSVKNLANLFVEFPYVVIDECHLVSEKGMYQKFFRYNKKKILGLTATPYRLKTEVKLKRDEHTHKLVPDLKNSKSILQMLTSGRQPLFPRLIYSVETSFLMQQGYLCPLRYFNLKPTTWQEERLFHNTTGSDYADNSVRWLMDKTHFNDYTLSIVNRLLHPKDNHPRNGILVFTRFVKDAQTLSEQTPSSAYISGDTPLKERERILSDFGQKKIKVLYNAQCLIVGYDRPDLDTVVLASPTMSLARFYQECLSMDTEVLTKRGFMSYDDISENDMVASYKEGSIEFLPIQRIVHRSMRPDEKFITFDNMHLSFKVTENHDMLFGKSKYHKFTKRPAWQMLSMQSIFEVPISGVENVPDAPLSDAEIKFLGYAISDGNMHKKSKCITIVQSFKNQKYIEDIELTLQQCNFRYGKILSKRKGEFAKYADSYHFTISFGEPLRLSDRAKGLHGWNRLADYYNGCKMWVDTLDTLSKRQFDIFLSAIYNADGNHASKLDYTPHSFVIHCGDKRNYADRLQSLMVRRGYLCKQATYINERGNTMYVLHYKEKSYVTINGCNVKDNAVKKEKGIAKRSHLQSVQHEQNDEVWCVTNANGTIVTRRNGKIIITGNCGRAMRISPNKTESWIIDLVGNTHRFGNVESLRLSKVNDKWEIFSQDDCQLTDTPLS